MGSHAAYDLGGPAPIRRRCQAWTVRGHGASFRTQTGDGESRNCPQGCKARSGAARPALEHQQTSAKTVPVGRVAVAGVQPGEPVHRGEELPGPARRRAVRRRTHPALFPPARRRRRPADRLRCRPPVSVTGVPTAAASCRNRLSICAVRFSPANRLDPAEIETDAGRRVRAAPFGQARDALVRKLADGDLYAGASRKRVSKDGSAQARQDNFALRSNLARMSRTHRSGPIPASASAFSTSSH